MESSSRIGTEFGGYRIDALLGRGRSGVVYDALELRPARRVALDLLDPEIAADPSFRRRFVREARRAAQLEHPNIIPLYAVGELDGQLYSAARFVDGDDLRTLLQREGPLAPARALFILQQAAHALDTARDAGVPHRAVDAQSILVERHSDHVYVCDFGLGPAAVPPLVPMLAAVLEEMLAGQERSPELNALLVRAVAGGKDGYASGAELVRAARAALRDTALAATAAEEDAAAGAVEAGEQPVEAAPLRPAPLVGPRRPRSRRRGGVLVGALALVAAAGLTLLVATHGSGSPTAGSPNGSTAAGTSPTGSTSRTVARTGTTAGVPAPRGQAAILLAEIADPAIRSSCSKARHPGGLATLLCSATGPHGTRIDLHVDHFGKPGVVLAALRNEAISSLVKAGGQRPASPGDATGRCDASTWLGTLTWRVSASRPGYAACFVATDSDEDCGRLGTSTCAVVYWTYEPENLYLRASAPAGATADLYAWWRSHRDGFGR